MKTASWVVTERSTGRVILETFEEKTARHIETMPAYEVKPIMEYLTGLNGGK